MPAESRGRKGEHALHALRFLPLPGHCLCLTSTSNLVLHRAISALSPRDNPHHARDCSREETQFERKQERQE